MVQLPAIADLHQRYLNLLGLWPLASVSFALVKMLSGNTGYLSQVVLSLFLVSCWYPMPPKFQISVTSLPQLRPFLTVGLSYNSIGFLESLENVLFFSCDTRKQRSWGILATHMHSSPLITDIPFFSCSIEHEIELVMGFRCTILLVILTL